MRTVNLALDQAPSLSVTLPFLAVAPWFAVAAGILLVAQGPAAFASRWTPGALALTHLLTVGFMLQAMCGAMLQFAPVVAGARIWRPQLSTRLAQMPMLAGGTLLPYALGTSNGKLVLPAAMLLITGIGIFVLSLLVGLWRSRAGARASWLLWLALAGLAVTASLGGWLGAGLAGWVALALVPLTDLHAAWGLGGWSLVLLIAVTSVVVPMLQLTPRFPRRLQIACAAFISAALSLWTLRLLASGSADGQAPAMAVALAAAVTFAVMLLVLVLRSRRPVTDATSLYIRIATVSIMLLGAWWLALLADFAPLQAASTDVAVGIVALVGVFVAAISGMMYKIVPFMLWVRLSRLHGARRAPATGSIIPQSNARGQFMLFALALAALIAAPFVPVLTRPAGALFAVASLWLAINVDRAVWVHRRAFGSPQQDVTGVPNAGR